MRSLTKSALFALLAGSMALSAGCGKGSKCEKAGEKVVALLGEMSKGMPEADAKKIKEDSGKMKTQFVADCKKKATDKELDCILAAKTMDDMDKCNTK